MSSNAPNVSVSFSNGNLLQNVANIDGYSGFIGTGVTGGNLGKVFIINNLLDAETQGITVQAEPAAHRQIAEFYQELAGNQTIYVLLLADTVTMAEMLDSTDATKALKLILAGAGAIAYLGVFKKPHAGYDGGTHYMDSDVEAALTAAASFMTAMNGLGYYFRCVVEGRVILANESDTTIFAPNTANCAAAGVVLGGSVNDGSASVGNYLGRKVKYPCHIKPGKVANGALQLSQVYIGTKLLSQMTNMDLLLGKGYISYVTYPNKAGIYYGIDNMANTGDYRLMVYACVVDAAARVAQAVFINLLESEVDVQANGTILEIDALHLEDRIIHEVKYNLGDRLSDFYALVDRTINVVTSQTTALKLRVLPKGYNTFIELDLGLTGG